MHPEVGSGKAAKVRSLSLLVVKQGSPVLSQSLRLLLRAAQAVATAKTFSYD
jgi:hypothetical protein